MRDRSEDLPGANEVTDRAEPAHSNLRSEIAAHFARLMERCFGDGEPSGGAEGVPGTSSPADAPLAASLERLLAELAQLPREQLLGLRIHGARPTEESPPGRRASEDLVTFRRVANASGFGFAVADLRGTLTYANPVLARLLGEDQSEPLIGRSLFDYYAPELRQSLLSQILPTVLKEGQWSGELPLQTAAGAEIPTLQSLFVVRGQTGAPPYLASLILDISARKQAEDALRASEERFRSIFEHSTIGIYQTTPDGRILLANPALVRMLGYSSEAELQRLDLEEGGYAPLYARRDFKQRIERDGRIVGHEAVWLRRDGSPVHVRESARAVLDNVGRTLYYEGTVEDVTEVHRAAEAMRTSEENFRALAENASDGIMIAVGDGETVYANPRAAEITGYSVAELIGMSHWDLAHPAESQKIDQRYHARIDGRHVPRQYETRIVAKDGRHVPIELTGSRTTWYGKPADIIFFRDVTNRKLAEQALRESEEKYRTLVEQIDEALYEFDAEGVFTYLSPAIERITGYRSAELLGRTFIDMVPPEDLPEARERMQRIRLGQAPRRAEIRLLTKDGEYCWVRHHSRPIEIGGQPAGMRGVVTDITDLKEAEVALRESEEKFRLLVEELGEIVYEFGPDGRITYISPAIRAYGYEPDELIGKTTAALVPEEDQQEVLKQLEGITEGHTPQQAEGRLLTKSGEIRWMQHLSRYVERDGRRVGMRGVIVDVHERKMAEEALRASESRYRRLIEEIDAIIYEHDAAGTLTFVSSAVEPILGFSPAELISRPVADFVAPDAREDALQAVADLMTGGREHTGEHEVRTKSGETRWLRYVSRALMKEGRVVGARGIVYDITEYRRTAQALAESQVQYESVVEHLIDGVLIVQDEQIRFANPTVARVSGYSNEELVGMHFLEMVAPEQRAMVAARHQQRLAGEDEPTFYIMRIQRKDGRQTDIEIAVSLIPFSGRPAVLAVMREIAQRTERSDDAP